MDDPDSRITRYRGFVDAIRGAADHAGVTPMIALRLFGVIARNLVEQAVANGQPREDAFARARAEFERGLNAPREPTH